MATTTILAWGGASAVVSLLGVIFFLLWRSEKRKRKQAERDNDLLRDWSAKGWASHENSEAERKKLREENASLLDLPGLVGKLNGLSANQERPGPDPVPTD